MSALHRRYSSDELMVPVEASQLDDFDALTTPSSSRIDAEARARNAFFVSTLAAAAAPQQPPAKPNRRVAASSDEEEQKMSPVRQGSDVALVPVRRHDSGNFAVAVPRFQPQQSLQIVPAEVVSLMLTNLDALSLVRFARTSRLHNRLAGEKSLWRALLRLPWSAPDPYAGRPIDGVDMEVATKQYYAARRLHAIQIHAMHLKQYRTNVHKLHVKRFMWPWLRRIDYCFLPIVAALTSVFLICLVFQLAKDREISMFSLWPLLALCGWVAFVSSVFCCLRWYPSISYRLDAAQPLESVLGEYFYEAQSPLKALLETIGKGKSSWAHATFCCMTLVIALFTVLIVLQLTGHIHWNWWVVFSPIYVVFASFCCAPCFRWPATTDMKIAPCVAVYAFLGVPLLAFAVLLNLHLVDSHLFGLTIVFVPLWVLDGLSFAIAVAFCIGERSSMFMLMWLFGDGPFVAFKLLLALSADGVWSGANPAYTFIPLFVVQLVLLVGATMFGAMSSGIESERKDDEPPPFNEIMPRV